MKVDPDDLRGAARALYDDWRSFGLSERAALVEVVRAGHIPVDEAELETARFEKSLRAWGVNESIARTAARINPCAVSDPSSVLAEFGLRESDALSEFRAGTPSVRENASSTGAPTVLGAAAREFAEALIRKHLTESQAVAEAIAEAKAQVRDKGSEAAAAEALRHKAAWLREGASGQHRNVRG